jgi:predicted acetyltransferase
MVPNRPAKRRLSMELVVPAESYLPGYVDALRRGWSPDNLRPEASQEELAAIERDAPAFLASLDDPGGLGEPIVLPDGARVPRLPGFQRWMWDGEFCGSIGFRWAPGTAALPETCFGHIGYGVVPWKRGRGYASEALRQLMPHARTIGLPYVELTTRPDNVASQRVILANGGVLIERFEAPRHHGAGAVLRFRIPLTTDG